MSALYVISFVGLTDAGNGLLYIGKGVIAGMDTAGVQFDGSYSETTDGISGTVKMTVPAGVALVTGQALPSGGIFELKVNWPPHFANGSPQPVLVAGRPVHVVLSKMRDLP
jgi:hypothetical protein